MCFQGGLLIAFIFGQKASNNTNTIYGRKSRRKHLNPICFICIRWGQKRVQYLSTHPTPPRFIIDSDT
ncbi:hypothetical protein L2E82_12778 [Cichorium intybus]|uniref:Uncharacterized protein n=1 Tax=Cichorium intybus TaxID=13427 RepID=A0ACB9GGG9_CICIN|nr:hypothetical protein L2E82_12778 [Cichorium intybus]